MDDDDTYRVVVTFERQLSEDEEMARDKFPGVPLREALAKQLRDELQEACDTGMAGFFQVGPVTLPPGAED
jgi:hypothetical protein